MTLGESATATQSLPGQRLLRHNRDFTLLWTSQVVSTLGSRITSVAFPLLALTLGGSATAAGAVGMAASAPYLLFQLPAGVLVDRYDRRRLMLICDALRILALASLPAAAWFAEITLPHLLVVAFLDGTGFVVFTLAEETALPSVVRRSQLADALALNEARTRGATLAGQPLGGALFGVAHVLPFVVDACSYLISLLCLRKIRSPLRRGAARSASGIRLEIAEGLRWLWRESFVRLATVLVGGSNAVFQALMLLTIVLARERGATSAEIGVILGITGGAGLLGAMAATWLRRRLSPTVILVGVNWAWAATLPLMLIDTSPYLLGIAFGMMSFLGPVWNVVIGQYELAVIPDRLLGRVKAAGSLVAWGAIPIGSLAGGLLIDAVGATSAVLWLFGALLAMAIWASASPSARAVERTTALD